jgi:hypothetical protein
LSYSFINDSIYLTSRPYYKFYFIYIINICRIRFILLHIIMKDIKLLVKTFSSIIIITKLINRLGHNSFKVKVLFYKLYCPILV